MKILKILVAILPLVATTACLYTPEKTYIYWRLNERTQTYAPVRSEYPIDEIALREEGLVAELPADAKIVEAE